VEVVEDVAVGITAGAVEAAVVIGVTGVTVEAEVAAVAAGLELELIDSLLTKLLSFLIDAYQEKRCAKLNVEKDVMKKSLDVVKRE
jgi:hypothetical protein